MACLAWLLLACIGAAATPVAFHSLSPVSRYNLLIAPIALFVRAPIVLFGRIFSFVGAIIEQVGGSVPGLKRW